MHLVLAQEFADVYHKTNLPRSIHLYFLKYTDVVDDIYEFMTAAHFTRKRCWQDIITDNT